MWLKKKKKTAEIQGVWSTQLLQSVVIMYNTAEIQGVWSTLLLQSSLFHSAYCPSQLSPTV